jgi:putative MATE family efflux protein
LSREKITSWKNIYSLAWPHAVMNILFTLLMLVDIYWVGDWGGDDPITAISLCGPIIWAIQSGAMFIFYGLLSQVSRCVGSNNLKTSAQISHQGLIVGFVLGSVIAFLGFTTSDAMLSFYKTLAEIHDMAVIYLKIMTATSPMYYFFMAIYAIFSSNNNTTDPMFMTLAAWFINLILDPLLIYGIGPFPELGIEGAAMASFASYTVATLLFFFVFKNKLKQYAPIEGFSSFKPDWTIIKQIIKIGTPASIDGISRPISAIVLMKVVALYGKIVVAAFGIAVRLVSINWIILGGINIAVSSLVGQNLGAKSIKGAKQVVHKAWKFSMFFQVLISALLMLFSENLSAIFSTSPETIKETSLILTIFSIGTLADVYIAVYGGALKGAGDTARAMISSLFANWIFKLPASFILYYYFKGEIIVIYWIIAISLPAEGLFNFFWYRMGAWKRKEITISK